MIKKEKLVFTLFSESDRTKSDRTNFLFSFSFLFLFFLFLFSFSFSLLFFSSRCLFFLFRRFFPKHFYSEHRVSLQCSKRIPCALFIPYPDGVSTVKAAATCGVQIISRRIGSAAIAASQNSIFAEDKLSGQVQVLFQIIMSAFPAIRFLDVQNFTQFIIMFYIHLKLYFSVLSFYNK